MPKVAIIGAGISGFGASSFLNSEGIRPAVYEKESYYGGHTASFNHSGFIFDDGPHISFTKNKRIQEIFADSVDHNYETLQAKVNNYWKGHWIKHPVQCNLYGLPPKLIEDVLCDFIEARNKKIVINNYEDWLRAKFGDTFAGTFPMQYGKKFHTAKAHNMTTEWIGVRLYQPDLREVLHGALFATTPDVHYVDHFRYPTYGGFVSYLNKFLDKAELHLNHKIVSIDPRNKKLYFSNKHIANYDYLISSLPLPESILMIRGVPEDIVEASQKLACTSCVLVTLGVNRENISEAHWSYFYDDDICFSRLSYPHMQSPNNVPSGTGSIQAEIYFSKKYKPLDKKPHEFVATVIKDLIKCGILKETDEILFNDSRLIPYANVIFDHDRSNALKKVRGYLDDIGINCCGRYGKWGYHWTDNSFISGENAARKVLDIR